MHERIIEQENIDGMKLVYYCSAASVHSKKTLLKPTLFRNRPLVGFFHFPFSKMTESYFPRFVHSFN